MPKSWLPPARQDDAIARNVRHELRRGALEHIEHLVHDLTGGAAQDLHELLGCQRGLAGKAVLEVTP